MTANVTVAVPLPFDHPQWAHALAPLGLRPVLVRDITSISLWSFPTFRRELSDPPSIPTRASLWFAGERDGSAIVVRPMLLSPTAMFAAVVAEIDPPLFAGARVYSRELIPYFGHANSLPLGSGRFDQKFLVQAFDHGRLHQHVLGPNNTGERIQRALLDRETASDGPVVIRDWFVEALSPYPQEQPPDTTRLDGQIRFATGIARLISSQATSMPERPEETAARMSWESYAAQVPLSYDRRRWRMWGKLYGLDVEVALGGSPPSVITTFRVSFVQPLACGLYVRRGIYTGGGIFNRGGRKPPGYKELDKLLLIDAHDVNRQRALFADKSLRERLGAEAHEANVVITDNAITLTRANFASVSEIATRLESLAAIAYGLSPAMRTAGPFR